MHVEQITCGSGNDKQSCKLNAYIFVSMCYIHIYEYVLYTYTYKLPFSLL